VAKGRFITLEGGEGTGKSTLIAGLVTALRERGISVVVTREPGGTPMAEKIRELALNPPEDHEWSPLAHALLMNAAREDHLIRQIRPALERGLWVVCDRFADSTRAYQSTQGVSLSVLKQFEHAVVGETVPDLTLILDASPGDLAERRRVRAVTDVFEAKGMTFHNEIRDVFLEIAKDEPERCKLIDAMQPVANVLAAALKHVDALGT
jgi:dTMP kinase